MRISGVKVNDVANACRVRDNNTVEINCVSGGGNAIANDFGTGGSCVAVSNGAARGRRKDDTDSSAQLWPEEVVL